MEKVKECHYFERSSVPESNVSLRAKREARRDAGPGDNGGGKKTTAPVNEGMGDSR